MLDPAHVLGDAVEPHRVDAVIVAALDMANGAGRQKDFVQGVWRCRVQGTSLV